MSREETLTEAFHVLFDIKDESGPRMSVFVFAYDAIKALSTVMEMQGMDVPCRFDGQGRP